MNPLTGRFISRDPNSGNLENPASLHKYLYAQGDPVDGRGPSGRGDLVEGGLKEGEISEGAEAGERPKLGKRVVSPDAGAALDLVVPTGEALGSLIPEWKSCKAKCSEGSHVGFRAVSEQELYSINQLGMFTPSPMGGDVKYFFNTVEQAWKLAPRMYKDGNFGIVKGEFVPGSSRFH